MATLLLPGSRRGKAVAGSPFESPRAWPSRKGAHLGELHSLGRSARATHIAAGVLSDAEVGMSWRMP
jgi:hypothetical protein